MMKKLFRDLSRFLGLFWACPSSCFPTKFYLSIVIFKSDPLPLVAEIRFLHKKPGRYTAFIFLRYAFSEKK